MLIFDENNQTIVLNNVNDPVISDSCWVLDVAIPDYKLTKLVALEEMITPAIEIQIAGYRFTIPANWSLLVADMETTQVDCVEARNLAAKDFTALAYGPMALTAHMPVVTVTNYYPQKKIVAPIIGKTHMLCHPIAPGYWINISSQELYNKHLKNVLIGDII